MQCKYCGCTDEKACEGGCGWIAPQVCSRCSAKCEQITIPRPLLATLIHTAMALPATWKIWADSPDRELVQFFELIEEQARTVLAGCANLSALKAIPDIDDLVGEVSAAGDIPTGILLANESDIPPFPRELQL